MALLTQPEPISVATITAGEAITANTFVNGAGAYVASAGGRIVGVALADAASGELVAVQTAGTVIVTAGGTVDVGDAVQSTTAGLATAVADPTASVTALWTVVGEALTGGGNGDNILIRLI